MGCTDLALYAPIPRGHRVRLIDLKRAGSFLVGPVDATLAIDLTTGTYYIPHALFSDFRACTSPDMIDAVINSGKWRITHTYEGEVLASAVAIKESGEYNDACTRLFVTP
ncbi:hypothetical protein HPC49_25770 [Pyxidicoccus fallax]|uniref:Uncharacterized protein n=1 Tax=Pyxidicoccus fallax TaxID=394095 RepID=A0A848LS49_9BACT|nr:hypothetical protein [Pyxidicoccus fallax]NMO20765.1 hypothetical protein [Pyxidicoccus fallax]NPC81614.1 hypothetical protein [Pyxidicoccus fallax]